MIKGHAQTNDSSKSDRYYLVGTWLLESRDNSGHVFFKRKIGIQNKGDKFQLKLSNTSVLNIERKRITRRCGNDMRAASPTKGSWQFNIEKRILTTTIPIYLNFKKFKIVELTNRKMVLSIKNLD